MLLPYKAHKPECSEAAFIAPSADVIGDVVVGQDASVWYGAVLRGDVQPIRVGARTNVQEGAVLHGTTGVQPCVVGEDVTIGHRAIVHGCTLERGCLVGMGAIVLDTAVVGEEAIIGAGAIVTSGTVIPPRTLALGAPARVVRELREADLLMLRGSAAHYVELAAEHRSAADARDEGEA